MIIQQVHDIISKSQSLASIIRRLNDLQNVKSQESKMSKKVKTPVVAPVTPVFASFQDEVNYEKQQLARMEEANSTFGGRAKMVGTEISNESSKYTILLLALIGGLLLFYFVGKLF